MADDDQQTPQPHHDFGDLLGDLDGESTFDWDEGDMDAAQEDHSRPVVSFRIGRDIFAIDGTSVREIVGTQEVTPLPGAPPHIEGITVVRRQVVGLLSLRHFLHLDDTDKPQKNDSSTVDQALSTERTLIVDTAHYTVGLHVDEVTGLDEWPEIFLNPDTLPENMRETTRRYARGARDEGETLCVYLDLELLLDDASIQ